MVGSRAVAMVLTRVDSTAERMIVIFDILAMSLADKLIVP